MQSLTFSVQIPLRRGVLDTILCDKACQWPAECLFSSDTLLSSTNKTDHHDITEILLNVALNSITLTMCRFGMKWEPSNSTLSEQFKNPIEKWYKGSKIDTPSTQIHDRALFLLGTGTSIKRDEVKLVLLAQAFALINDIYISLYIEEFEDTKGAIRLWNN